jgi:hypothetical protein
MRKSSESSAYPRTKEAVVSSPVESFPWIDENLEAECNHNIHVRKNV